jgi:hypothetical protein
MLFKEIIPIYSEDFTEPIDTLCGQNGGLLNVEVGATLHS